MSDSLLGLADAAADDASISSDSSFNFEHPLFAALTPGKPGLSLTSQDAVTQLLPSSITTNQFAPQVLPSIGTSTTGYLHQQRQPLAARKPFNDAADLRSPTPTNESTFKLRNSTVRWKTMGRVGLGPPKRAERVPSPVETASSAVDPEVSSADTSSSTNESLKIEAHDEGSTDGGRHSSMSQATSAYVAPRTAIVSDDVPAEYPPAAFSNTTRPGAAGETTTHNDGDTLKLPIGCRTPPSEAAVTATQTATRPVKFNFNVTPARPAPPAPHLVNADVDSSPGIDLDGSRNKKFKPGGRITMHKREFIKLGLIGKGGSSKVYRVMAPSGDIFAIKKVDYDDAEPATIQSYKLEVSLLRHMKKSAGAAHVIAIHGFEIDDAKGRLLVLMEVGEIDLLNMLKARSNCEVNFDFVRFYWRQMLEAVKAVHDENIVHSDLKPANFLMVTGVLKLIDFGIAKEIGNNTINIHRDQQVGTINYMSPEAFEDTGGGGPRLMKLGRPSDVWSLGCILYQMIYGRTPFAHLGNSHLRIAAIQDPRHHIHFPKRAASPASASEGSTKEALGPIVGADMLRVLRGCLTRDQRQRPTIPQLLVDPLLVPNDKATPLPSDQIAIDMPSLIDTLRHVVTFTRDKTLNRQDTTEADIESMARDIYHQRRRRL